MSQLKLVKKATTTKKVAARPTAKQVAWNIPIGDAIDVYFSGASEEDFKLKTVVDTAIDTALGQLHNRKLTSRHIGMAFLHAARRVLEMDMACMSGTANRPTA